MNVKRVLIVDDSLVVRETLSSIVSQHPDLSVIGLAENPFEAAKFIKKEVPDVILLDIEMPRMDGITFLKRLMSQRPVPVVICSSLVGQGSRASLEALEAGAVELIKKPVISTKEYLEESKIRIQDVVLAAAKVKLNPVGSAPKSPPAPTPPSSSKSSPIRGRKSAQNVDLIAIGASTGGTDALKTVLSQLPTDFPPIVIVQHMPEHFTAAFANRLDAECRIRVVEGENDMALERGMAVIAPGNKHMSVAGAPRSLRVEVREGPLVSRHRPSVDVLFRSAAARTKGTAIGVLLTGMGSDGATGLLDLRKGGAFTIGQNQQTCTVYGMSRAALEKGAVEVELALNDIPQALVELCSKKPAAGSPARVRS
ncbi:MAG: chemotaxis response regulator protein-glutamate methylesterase [Pseudomonadota bacterium]